jgi:hypothetical protein
MKRVTMPSRQSDAFTSQTRRGSRPFGWMDWTGVERNEFISMSLDRISRSV